MNTNEFTHVNETSFSRPDPMKINSDTPIIPEEVYERHYDNYQENEEVAIDEKDLDDTPTSPDLNSTKVPPPEDNPSVGTSRPPIVPTRDNVKNPKMSMPQVGPHGSVKHELGLDSSNKCEFVKYLEQGSNNITNDEDSAIGCGSDNGMTLQDRQRALPRPVVAYDQSIAELEKSFTGLYNY
ncbi:hypothetical protein H5410_047692 [Solanum commersonii]|uniref:Uncharacterized protein n=1 Tax=Solanum commersonii TaxID=4109 RepID=A0A9J5XHV1_SOLCO|nr:hypothetical protein H5410_047692 [Solanum commersonii]